MTASPGPPAKVLVIGGTGFIGRRVAAALRAGGHRVWVLHRGTTRTPPAEGLAVLHGDRNRRGDLERAMEAAAPDVVVDLALYTQAQARAISEVAGAADSRLVAVSSSDVYRNYDGFRGVGDAPPDPVPLTEGAPLRESRYPYRGSGLEADWVDDYDKILVERAVRESGIPAAILRLPAVFGPGDPQDRVGEVLGQMERSREILLPPEKAGWRWTRGYVGNVGAAVARAAVDPRALGRTYNVGRAETLTERRWVEAIAEAAGWDGTVREAGVAEGPFDYAYELVTDTSRIRAELGYRESVPLAEALAATVRGPKSSSGDADPSEEALASGDDRDRVDILPSRPGAP